MVPRQIKLPREYFDYVVTPDVNEFIGSAFRISCMHVSTQFARLDSP